MRAPWAKRSLEKHPAYHHEWINRSLGASPGEQRPPQSSYYSRRSDINEHHIALLAPAPDDDDPLLQFERNEEMVQKWLDQTTPTPAHRDADIWLKQHPVRQSGARTRIHGAAWDGPAPRRPHDLSVPITHNLDPRFIVRGRRKRHREAWSSDNSSLVHQGFADSSNPAPPNECQGHQGQRHPYVQVKGRIGHESPWRAGTSYHRLATLQSERFEERQSYKTREDRYDTKGKQAKDYMPRHGHRHNSRPETKGKKRKKNSLNSSKDFMGTLGSNVILDERLTVSVVQS